MADRKMTLAQQEAALAATRDRAAEAEQAALTRDHEEAEAAAAKRGDRSGFVGPDKAKLDEQFRARQAAEAAKADEGSSRPMVDERLTPAEQRAAAKEEIDQPVKPKRAKPKKAKAAKAAEAEAKPAPVVKPAEPRPLPRDPAKPWRNV